MEPNYTPISCQSMEMRGWRWVWRLWRRVMHFKKEVYFPKKGEKVRGRPAWWGAEHLEILIMMHVSVMDIQMFHRAGRGECGDPLMRGGTSFPPLFFCFFFCGCIRQNTAMEDEWRTTYLICGGRRSIYLSQTWGPARRRAADGWGSGRIWTGTGRTAPWLRSGCCSSAGVSLQGTGGGSGALQSVRNKGYTLGVVTGGERERKAGREGVMWREVWSERLEVTPFSGGIQRLIGFMCRVVKGNHRVASASKKLRSDRLNWNLNLKLRRKVDQKWINRQL